MKSMSLEKQQLQAESSSALQEMDQLRNRLSEIETQYEHKMLQLSNREMKESIGLQKVLEQTIHELSTQNQLLQNEIVQLKGQVMNERYNRQQ